MAIIRNITTAKPVVWNGEEVAQVRGLSPNDLAIVLEREGEGLRDVLSAFDDLDVQDVKDKDQVAGALMQMGPQIVVHLAKAVPSLLASIIVVASDGNDDDVEYVEKNWPLALQFLALTDIAVLSFSGAEGFRTFVGNAFALVGLAKTLTGADKATGTGASTPSESGATQSLN